jgi:S-(hydroxymethyl)glutathione dehydrogenase/alcohol dehydrogenase
MIAAVLEELKKPLVIHKLELPNLDYGQILVELKFSGICGRQIQEINGDKGADKFLPHLLGHEGGGIVKKIGLGVSKCKIGEHVVLHWRSSKGIQSKFPSYKSIEKKNYIVGGGLVTTFNDYAIVSENRITVVPKSISFETCALLGCSLTTALGLVSNEAKIKIGQSILIFGSGSVGLSLVQACNMVSACPVVIVDIKKSKLEFALKIGASEVLNYSDNLFDEKIKKIFGIKGPDFIIDTVGSPEIINKSYSMLSNNGNLIMVGQPKVGQDIVLKNASINFLGKKIFDSQGGSTDPDTDIERYARIIDSGKINFENIITDVVNIKDINNAIDNIKTGKTLGKTLIKFG